MDYKFFIQKYPLPGSAFPKLDVESHFGCKYISLTNSQNSEVKNIYTEDYAESSKLRTFTPVPDDRAYKSQECVLSLLFHSADCLSKAEALFDYIGGQKIEFSDSFRNRFIQLIPTKYSVKEEILYRGADSYQVVEVTCTKFDGQSYTESQL